MKHTPELIEKFRAVASLIKKSKNIILMPHAKMDCDGMSASVALHLILNKFGKHSTTVCSDPVPEAFSFLPSSNIFSQDIVASETEIKQFHLNVNTTNKKFKKLEYTVEDGKVNIILFSEDTPFEENDFTFIGAQLKPDLIITLDSGDTRQLGKMYDDNTELFDEVPVINIDHHFSNTQFGNINLVEHTSSSTTELIYSLIPYLEKEWNTEEKENTIPKILDANISTLLLAGMLTDTGSFQHANTTPEALDIASILIDNGAEHQKIVKQLFKTKSLSTLKIWGKVLTKLQNDPLYKIVWSSVSRTDLEETGSHSDDTNDLIDDLMATTPNTELVLLVKEREDNIISTSVRSSSDEVDSVEFTSIFGGGGHKQAAGFKIRERGGKSFEEIVADIVFEAKLFQSKRLHVPTPQRGIEHLISTEKTETTHIIPEIQEPIETPTMPDFPQHLEESTQETAEKSETPAKTEKVETIEISQKTEENKESKKREESKETYENKEIKEIKEVKEVKEVLDTQTKENKGDTTVKNEGEQREQKTKENTNLFGENIEKEARPLSEEEIPYAKHKEYFSMPQPEKYIEKQEEETDYDDFAEFLAKADEDEEVEYLTEIETATPKSISQNPFPTSTKIAEAVDPFLESIEKAE